MEMTPPRPDAEVERLWKATLEKVKVRLVLPGVWRAMEAARPLVVDGNTLVIGFSASHAHEGGLLQDSKTTNIIERALEEEAGRNLRLRMIEGETLEDWQACKRRDEQALALQKAAQERRQREASVEQGWDAITERLTRRYAEMPLRQLPQMQALYLQEAVEALADAARRLLGENASEVDHRSFARVIDRVADRAQVPAAMVAYLVRQKSGE
jgi:hypothetical protein